MSEDVTCTIDGLDELEQKLNELAPAAAKRAVRRSVREGLKVFQTAIEEKAPRDTGHLAESINIGTKTTGGDGEDTTGGILGVVGPAKDAFYALFQEFGTKHQHAQPFITPAYEENKDVVLQVFRNTLNEELEGLKE
jgi:HK97 gp10 family phage protein